MGNCRDEQRLLNWKIKQIDNLKILKFLSWSMWDYLHFPKTWKEKLDLKMLINNPPGLKPEYDIKT